MPSAPSRWTAPLRPVACPARRLVVFPHAGSGPRRYAELASALPDDADVLGVTLPGRERRDAEPAGTTVREAVSAIAGEVAALPPAPTVFYGHSMGALLATATAYAAPGQCHFLVASCSPPGRFPHSRLPPGRGATPHEDELAAILSRHGLPADAPDNRSLPPAHTVLAHDLRLAHGLLTAVEVVSLPVPLIALGGRDDHLVDPELLSLWGKFTSVSFRAQLVDGGHFFPFTPYGGQAVLDELSAALADAVRITRVSSAAPGCRAHPWDPEGRAPGARPALRPR
ncbi:thioesterase II family protein [Streptomyces sp. NPDC056347]|uniref:thioesterase II family protein n=1 Tax=Streptomyces sp. NPDC056347 TaxID=3345790 RepID=UPI0035D71523